MIRYFVLDLIAAGTPRLTGISLRSVNAIDMKLRQHLTEHHEAQSPFGSGVEVDEFYFGPKRVRGKRDRGTDHKASVFGLYKRNAQVFTGDSA